MDGKRRKRRWGREEKFGPPDLPDRSTPLVDLIVETEIRRKRKCGGLSADSSRSRAKSGA